jgi:hypothetical protein
MEKEEGERLQKWKKKGRENGEIERRGGGGGRCGLKEKGGERR